MAQKDLTEGQFQTGRTLQDMSRMFDFKLGGLCARCGIDSEQLFMDGLIKILSEIGYEVSNFLMMDTDGFIF